MPEPATDSRRSTILLSVLAAAAAIRLSRLGDASLWLDECGTLYARELPLSVLWVSAYNSTPPLFYTIEKLFSVFGHSELVLRLPSASFGVLTIWVMYRAAAELAGFKAGVAVALVLTLSSANIEFSQEARAYALLGFCVSVAFLGLVRLSALLERRPAELGYRELLANGGALFVLGAVAALYSHNAAVFFIAACQVFAVFLCARQGEAKWRCAGFWVAANAIVFVAWLPWLRASLEILDEGRGLTWLRPASAAQAWSTVRSVHGYRGVWTGQPFADLVLVGLACLGLYRLRDRPVVVLLVAALLSSTLGMWLASFVEPVFLFRTILWGSLFSAVLVGVGVSSIDGTKAVPVWLLIAALGLQSTRVYFALDTAQNEDWKSAAAYVASAARPGDSYLLCADYASGVFFYYAGGIAGGDTVYGWSIGTDELRQGQLAWARAYPRVRWQPKSQSPVRLPAPGDGQLWLIEGHCRVGDRSRPDRVQRAVVAAGWRAQEARQFRRVRVGRYAQ